MGLYLSVLLMSVICYIGSVGPAAWLFKAGLIPEPIAIGIRVFYFPLVMIMHKVPMFEDFMKWYMSFFE
jgi:hypothetical protein